MFIKKPDELLKNGLIELGLTFSSEQVNIFMNYLTELKKWNKVYNLTGLKRDEDIIIKHFLDSLLYLSVIPNGKIMAADIGSGAGFPGLPIKIIRPEIEIFLIEPSKKKSSFLRHIIMQLRLEKVEVIGKRIEEIKVNKEIPSFVDVGMTRALFDIKAFIKKTSPIVKKDGFLILSKGPKVTEEIAMLKKVDYEVFTLLIPMSDIKRNIVIVKVQ
ncbi:MAG: 16S rRNA (guanine(527)-N(7))-methyltransferase RsmG [Nitrospirae bacterium]|nr:16S rRNA (guanine(527)-N(7))-methyltransferase RsmG [Nitrospirota bacterium]